MDDARVWGSEEGLWTGGPDNYRAVIDPECLMVLPDKPYVFTGEDAVADVSRTPLWTKVVFGDQQVSRPQEGLIVIAYSVRATRDAQVYDAYCTTTYRRLEHDDWRVVQHQQTPSTSTLPKAD